MRRSHRQSTLSLCASGLLLALACNPMTVRADTVVFRDDFSQRLDWSQPDPGVTVTLDHGVLLMSNRDARLQNTSIKHSFLMTGALNYRVSTEIAFTQVDGQDAYAGIELISPSGDAIGFFIAPKSRVIASSHWSHEAWAKAPLASQGVEAIKLERGAVNSLVVESNNGAFSVFVNEVLVGSTKAIDFAPSAIALRGGDVFEARFGALQVTETTPDTRLTRYQLMALVPGQMQLAFDDFTSYSGLSKLMSLTKDKNDRPEWYETFDNAIGRVQIDGARKRMLLEAKTESRGVSNTISSWAPLAYAGVSVNARLNLLKLAEADDCAGIMVEGRQSTDGERDLLFGCVNQTQAMLKFFNSNTGEWALLQAATLVVPRPASVHLRLVINDEQLLLFVDGRLHATGKKPQGFRYHAPGVKIDPAQAVEVLEFQATEI